MMAAITGIGWVTAAGAGSGSGTARFSVPAGPLPAITREMAFSEAMPRFGRMDDLSRLALTAIALTLKDAGLFAWQTRRPIGVLAGTVYGCLPTDAAFFATARPDAGQFASPALFAYTLPNCMLGEAAIVFGLTGPSYVISNAAVTDTVAIRTALEDITAGMVDRMICGVCDLGRPDFAECTTNGPPGAVFFMLENHPPETRRIYGGLDLAGTEEVTFNGMRIASLADLVGRCLDRARPEASP